MKPLKRIKRGIRGPLKPITKVISIVDPSKKSDKQVTWEELVGRR